MYTKKVRGFLVSDSIIGLLIIGLAVGLFCFNQSCFMKNEDQIYLKNMIVQQAYFESIKGLSKNQKIEQIKINGRYDEYEVHVIKN